MSEWKLIPLGELTHRITKGTTPSKDAFGVEGVSYVKVESISDVGTLLHEKLGKITCDAHESLQRSQLQEHDVLFTIAGTIGRVASVPREILPANTNQAVAIIRPDLERVEPRYLQYALSARQFSLNATSRTVQSVQANLSLSQLSSLELPIPTMPQQRAIAEVLGALDDKIAANLAIMTKMRELGDAAFYGAMAENHTTVTLSDVAIHRAGKYLSKEEYAVDGKYVVYGSNSVMGTYDQANVVGPHSVLARIGSYCGALRWSNTSSWVNNNASAITAIPDRVDAWVLGKALEGIDMNTHKAGTGQPYIRVSSLMSADLQLPSSGKSAVLGMQLKALADGNEGASAESKLLEKTRDALLPQLMSGKLRVRDAEKIVSGAV